MATGWEKKSAATRDNEQALAEAPSSAIDAFWEMYLEASCPCGVRGRERKQRKQWKNEIPSLLQ